MFPGRHIHRTQDIICTTMRYLFSINERTPSRIVNLSKDYRTALRRVYLIFQGIRFIACQYNRTQAVCTCRSFHFVLELFIHHCYVGRIYLMQRFYFFIGIVHILHLVDKPGITQRMRIKYRNSLALLQRNDEITCIQHIQHRSQRIAYLT